MIVVKITLGAVSVALGSSHGYSVGKSKHLKLILVLKGSRG